jgi:hypothetical protein
MHSLMPYVCTVGRANELATMPCTSEERVERETGIRRSSFVLSLTQFSSLSLSLFLSLFFLSLFLVFFATYEELLMRRSNVIEQLVVQQRSG